MNAAEFSFLATPEKGRVSALLVEPGDAIAALVLGHGAGASMRHAHMQAIAESLAARNVATLRFNFPYMQARGGRTDNKQICTETFANAVILARSLVDAPLFAGGHSFGGRMASHYVAEKGGGVAGLIYYSFPLHPARKPGVQRAAHLTGIAVPQLFLSGTRDALAELPLLRGVVNGLKYARLHVLDTADHGFKILKRTRKTPESVYDEAAEAAAAFIRSV